MDIKQCCCNCKFFRAYYAKDDEGHFYKVNNGHCTQPRIGVNQFRRSMKSNCSCYFWQQAEAKDDNMIDTIKNMAARIEQIATYLKID